MAYLNHGSRRNFIEQMEGLVNLCSAKRITLLPGDCAKTNCKDTIWLPWLPENATEDDFLKFFTKTGHEQAHFEGGSDVDKMKGPEPKHERLHAMLVNIVDDIRCENNQEIEYPGWKMHRRESYALWVKEHGIEKFKTATKDDLSGFVHALGCLAIMRVRHKQLGMPVNFDLSKDLKRAYKKYFRDLEAQMDAQEGFEDALRLAGILLQRLKEMLKDDAKDKDESKDESKPSRGSKESSSEEPNEEPNEEKDEDNEDSSFDGDTSNDDDDSDDEEGDGGAYGVDPLDEDNDDADESEGSSGGESDHDGEKSAEAEKAAEEALEELNEDEELKTTIDHDMTADIDAIGRESDEYIVAPGVKDRIRYNDYTNHYGYGTPEIIQELGRQILGASLGRLTRLFVANTRPRVLRNQLRGRLDMRAVTSDVWDTRKDLRARRVPGRLSKAAVTFIMDNSGSMIGERARKSYAIMSAMLEPLSRACVPTEVVGFTLAGTITSNKWRDCPVNLDIVKKFTDRYDADVMRRCVPPITMHNNCETDCLRWAVPRLLQRPEGKKILFFLGDGMPLTGNGAMDAKLGASFKRYIEGCKEVGILVCGIGIDCDLSWVFGDDFIRVSVGNMGEVILSKLQTILNRQTK